METMGRKPRVEGGASRDEILIREAIDEWAKAIREKNAADLVARYAPDNVMFVLAPPLQYTKENAPGKKGVEEWFASFRGRIGLEIEDLRIAAGDRVAYSHSLNHLSGSKSDGEELDMWMRETLCFRLFDGEWKITHQHESVPFYMDGSGRAATDLEP